MTLNARANLAHNGRVVRPRPRSARVVWRGPGLALIRGVAPILLAGTLFARAAPASDTTATPSKTPGITESAVPPPVRPPEIPPQLLRPVPAPGKGRLEMVVGGNRRWCTYPDDRTARPLQKPGAFEKRNEVFTFGYQFTVAAVRRGQADTPLMLYESPVFRTASWIPAFKLGKNLKSTPARPIIAGEGDPRLKPKETPIGPDTLVPFWHEPYRCVTMPDRMDFDLEPGTYDVYMAFDLLDRDGGWVHRSIGFLTDVRVEAARRTRLDGRINLAGGSDRQVELQSAAMEPEVTASPAAPGP